MGAFNSAKIMAAGAVLALGLGGQSLAQDANARVGASSWFGSAFSGPPSNDGGAVQGLMNSAVTDFDTSGAEWSDRFDPSSEAVSFNYESRQPTLGADTVQNIQSAIARYSDIAARGGWGYVPEEHMLRVGVAHESVRALRQRLIISGDLHAEAGLSSTFDTYVEAAVRRFQARHGLLVDGIVRSEALQALNVPVETRLEQLQTNLVRVQSMSGDLGDRYVMVNIPGAEIEAVENGEVVSRHTAVVGKIDRPSPLLTSRVVELNFNPYWTVPTSIIKKDIIPKMQEDPEYLTRYRIRIYDSKGNELDPSSVDWYSDEAASYMLRQDPGDQNSLGSIRINFPNQHAVYLHDTPLQNLFGTNDRFHSSGCVRVQNIRQLVTWLLEPNGDWSRAKVDATSRSGERLDVRLKVPAGLYFTYITAWATSDGTVQFRPDIYNRDGYGAALASEM